MMLASAGQGHCSAMDSWLPILEGQTLSGARAAIVAIAEDLPVFHSQKAGLEASYPFSLGFGATGVGIFYYYSWLVDGNKSSINLARSFLSAALESLAGKQMPFDCLRGVAGIIWAYEHSKNALWPGANMEESCEEIDAALQRWCEVPGLSSEFLDGRAGLSAYVTERHGRESVNKLLKTLMQRIMNDAELLPQGTAWRVASRIASHYVTANPANRQAVEAMFASGVYKVSLAHGTAGVLGALNSCYLLERNSQIRATLQSATEWILSKRKAGHLPQQFPEMVGAEFQQLTTGWCNGDLGIGIVLFNVAASLQNETWREQALDILAAESCRTVSEIEEFNRSNYNFCHGAAGRAHVFNRLYQETGDSMFRLAAVYWIEHALALRQVDKGIGGFLVHEPTNGGSKTVSGLLMGATGLALVLLAAVSNVEPRWDRTLLISAAPKGKAAE
jgi:lantibiotic biosynthesis protein